MFYVLWFQPAMNPDLEPDIQLFADYCKTVKSGIITPLLQIKQRSKHQRSIYAVRAGAPYFEVFVEVQDDVDVVSVVDVGDDED